MTKKLFLYFTIFFLIISFNNALAWRSRPRAHCTKCENKTRPMRFKAYTRGGKRKKPAQEKTFEKRPSYYSEYNHADTASPGNFGYVHF